MKNRKLTPPILTVLILSLLAHPSLRAQAQVDTSTAPDSANPVQTLSATAPTPVEQTAPATTSAASPVAVAPIPKHTIAYTVVKGDSLTSLAQKFNTTRKKLRDINNLTVNTLKPGQVLLVPSYKKSKKAIVAHTPGPAVQHPYPVAQPVQELDVPQLTLTPTPRSTPDSGATSDSATIGTTQKPYPVARLVSPAEMAAEPPPKSNFAGAPSATDAPSTRPTNTIAAPTASTKSFARAVPVYLPAAPIQGGSSSVGSGLAASGHPPTAYAPPAPRPPGRTLSQILGFDSPDTTSANDWGARFTQQARALGSKGIDYDEEWRPPGEAHAWAMDCSNTARYLYKVTAGIDLPRTASDQYYYLHQQGKAWDVPLTAYGFADGNYLRRNLKPGDLLFWENTYRPERQPPITHVMIFLGTNAQGQWLMAGSQTSRGGEHNRRDGGPDIYIFRPSQPCGGYSTWLGLVHHQGRFCAFGRPLEADRTKLSVAESE